MPVVTAVSEGVAVDEANRFVVPLVATAAPIHERHLGPVSVGVVHVVEIAAGTIV